MTKNVLQKPIHSFKKGKSWTQKTALLLFFIVFSITNATAQNPDLVWAKAMGSTGTDLSRSVAVDVSGNVYTTGTFLGTVDFDPNAGTTNLTSAGAQDIFVTKLDASGNLVWAKAMGGATNDFAYGIAVDASGNVYTTGYFQGTADFDPNAGTTNLTSNANNDIFVSKLDASGNLVWAKAMGSINNDIGFGIAVDASANVYFTGGFTGTTDFDSNAGTTNLTSAGGLDFFISKLDASGNLVWAKAMGSTGSDIGYGITVDASNNVYTSGSFQGTVDFDPNAGTTSLTSTGGVDIFISKLDSAGNLVWAKAMGGADADIGYGIAVDAAANVYTTGYFSETVDFNPNAATTSLTSAGGQDIFVSKLDTSGNFVWAKAIGSTSGDVGYGIALDAAANVYTTGYFIGTVDFDPNAGTTSLTSAGANDIFISKLDTSGNFVWAKAMGSESTDIGYEIAVDASNNVYTTGYFQGTADFDPNAGISNLSAGGQDIFIHKMSQPSPGAALDFDGANDYVGLTAPTNLPIGNSNYTIEAWIKPSALGVRGIVGWGNWGVGNQCNAFRLSPTGLVNYWWGPDLSVNYAFALNTWYHVACSFDGTTRTIYVNGVVIGSDTPGSHTVPNTNFRIGSTNNAEYFSGGIDEVRIWNRGLPQAEIVNNMNCELAAGQSGLIAYYQFNQGFENSDNSTITTLADASGNANTATLNNFALTNTTSNWVKNGGVTTATVCAAAAPLTTPSSATAVSCNGGSNGVAAVMVSGGYAPYTYNWSPSGGTKASATGLAAGTYICTITDASGTTATRSITITQPATRVSGTAVTTNVSCFGGSNGAINLTAIGGTAPYTYNWGGGITTEDRTGLVAGTYTCTITDDSGCATSVEISITQPTGLMVRIAQTNVSCNGGSNGSATISASGGTSEYTYSWSNGATTQTATGLLSGTYSCAVTDANGCSITLNNIVITQPAVLNATSTHTNVSCFNGANGWDGTARVVATGGTGPYTYSWSTTPVQTTATATGLVASQIFYSCKITDANLCSITKLFMITEPSAIIASTLQINVSCFGESDGAASVSARGGTNSFTYLWSNGATTQTIRGLAAGTYSVYVTDANGCTNTVNNIVITQPAVLNAVVTAITSVSCNGGSNGWASITASGGTSGYTYLWSNGATTQTATGLTAGTYSCTVTDANTCTKTVTNIVISQPALLNGSTAITNVACNGSSNGAITLSPTGGTMPYTYNWGGGIATKDRSGLAAGTYSVTITDNNGCAKTISNITITQPATIDATVSVSSGVITANQTGASYQWVKCPNTVLFGESNSSYTPTASGDYKVDITLGGCTASSTCVTISSLGITKLESKIEIAVYPNPSSDVFYIESKANGTITVNDLLGKTIQTQKINSGTSQLDLSKASSGVYLLKITNENNESKTVKLIKK